MKPVVSLRESLSDQPANSSRLRGPTYIGIVAHELAHWYTDDGYANPDVQVLGAVRPGMAP